MNTNPLPKLTGTPKIHYFYRTTFGIAQENIFGLQITVYDVQFRRGQEQKGSTQLLRKLSR